jgi:hypothetical protein
MFFSKWNINLLALPFLCTLYSTLMFVCGCVEPRSFGGETPDKQTYCEVSHVKSRNDEHSSSRNRSAV